MTESGGRTAEYRRREILNAIFYVMRNGCSMMGLPHDLPPYRIAFHFFRLSQNDGTWQRIHDVLGKRAPPSGTPAAAQRRHPRQPVDKMPEQGGLRDYDG